MPARTRSTRGMEITCPRCHAQFTLDQTLVDVLRQDWEAEAMQRLKKEAQAESRAEMEKTAERKAKLLAAKEVRDLGEQLRERDKRITSLRSQVTKLEKKLTPGRAQELGVVRQETLAEMLRRRFPQDVINGVQRGVRGADIAQVVCDGVGSACGSILWESKRAANWTRGWIDKLRADVKAGKHTVGVIVSDVLPTEGKVMENLDGVWVVNLDTACDLGSVLRSSMIEVASVRGAASQRDDLKGLVYDCLSGSEFVGHVTSVVETASKMRDDLYRERAAFEQIWSRREKQITGIVVDVASIYGDLKGIGASLPEVRSLELAPTTTAPTAG